MKRLASNLLVATAAALALMASSASLTACDSGTGEPPPFVCEVEPTLSSLQAKYFKRNCTASCHNPDDKKGELDLESAGLHARLINVPATDENAAVRGKVLVVAGDADISFMFQKVMATMEADEGALMPDGAEEPVKPDCYGTKLSEWIQAGALDN